MFRLPPRRFDAETGLLHPSTASFKEHAPSRLAVLVLRVLAALRLVRLTEDPRTGAITETTNLTILNVFLLRFGPRREDGLVKVLIASQVRLSTPFRPSAFANKWAHVILGRWEPPCVRRAVRAGVAGV